MSRIQKKELRNKFINSRNLIKNKSLKENEIVNKLKNLLNLNKIPTSAYYSVNSEVNLNSFIRYMQSKDQRIVLPSINKINSYLVFKEWKENEKLIIGKYNIKIPSNNFFLNPKILLIPMVAFDIKKNRLGYGGGYYDRTLSRLEKKNKIITIGIAFDEQETTKIPTMSFDKKMDLIITESRILI